MQYSSGPRTKHCKANILQLMLQLKSPMEVIDFLWKMLEPIML